MAPWQKVKSAYRPSVSRIFDVDGELAKLDTDVYRPLRASTATEP